MAKYLLQTSHNEGTYRNPFKRGGCGIRYSPWKTQDAFKTFDEAKAAWENFTDKGLERRRVQFEGKTLITAEGRIYSVSVEPVSASSWSGTNRTEKVLIFQGYMQD